MRLRVDLRHRLPGESGREGLLIEARFASAGRLTALFGPSGSGKTSVVNMIAGLLQPDHGTISIGERVLVDRAKRVAVAPHRRRIGYVFQDARLLPHLNVRQNLIYGRWFTPAAERYARFDAVVDLLGIGALLQRRPATLSGGEKQRVAIGRALLASPRLMLMDEPLASLDEARKSEILPFMERLRDETGIPIVYVSHSLAEVARLASDMVVLSNGKVVASGPTEAVMTRLDMLPDGERDEVGALLELEVVEHDERFGLTRLRSSGGNWILPRIDAPTGRRVRARIRARDVMLAIGPLSGISALNILPGTVAQVQVADGPQALVAVQCGSDRLLARITRRSVEMLALAPGTPVQAVIKAVTFDRNNSPANAPH